jgi:hypothetical protein
LAPEGFSRWTSYGATTGVYWRAALGFHFEPTGLEYTDRAIVGCKLKRLAKGGFVAVVPLDLHPQSGLALIGAAEQLGLIAASLADDVPSMGPEDVA